MTYWRSNAWWAWLPRQVDNYQRHLVRARAYLDAGVRTKIDVTNAEVNLSKPVWP